jgi:hypothetical protein
MPRPEPCDKVGHIRQQQKAKMPAAGATQALRLFCDPLVEIVFKIGTKKAARRARKNRIII